MVDLENPVVWHWHLAEQLSGGRQTPADEQPEVPEITRDSVVVRNESLARGDTAGGPYWRTVELAAFNFSTARGLRPAKVLTRKCAGTLLKVATEALIAVPWRHRRPAVVMVPIREALDLFKPNELVASSYAMSMWVASTLEETGSSAPETTEYFERAAVAAQHLPSLSNNEKAVRRIDALAGAGRAALTLGDCARAKEHLEEALALCPDDQSVADPRWPMLRLRLLGILSCVLEQLGDIEAALTRQGEAVSLIELLPTENSDRELALGIAIHALGRLLLGAQQHQDAIAPLREAYDRIRQLPEDLGLRRDITLTEVSGDLVRAYEAAGQKREAKELLGQTSEEIGVMAAAGLGEEGAAAVVELMIADGVGEEALRTLTEPEARLLGMLNADSEEVIQMIAEFEAAMATATLGGESVSSIWALLIADQHTKPFIEFYRSVLTLRRMGEIICAEDYVSSPDGELRFCDFEFADATALRKLVYEWDYFEREDIIWRSPGEEDAWCTLDPDSVDYVELSPDEPVQLCVSRIAPLIRPMRMPIARRIWEAFDVLVRAARSDKRPLHKCTMPRGFKAHLAYLSGETSEDAPKCGTFYISPRSAKSCGRAVCQQNYTLLQEHGLDEELWERAENVARCEFRQADVEGAFCEFWDRTEPDSPRQAVLDFRKRLESSRRNGPSKM